MTTFTYLAFDAAGNHVDGQIEANSARHAADLLHQKGLITYRTEPLSGRTGRLVTADVAPKMLSLLEFAVFTRQLATLIKAELPVDQCLRLVNDQAPKSRIGMFAGRLATQVVSGKSLSEAIELVAPNALPFVAPLIRAGEARGTLTPCLIDLARILERRVEVRNRVRGALVYPLLLLVLALLTVVLVVTVLVPTLMPLFKDSGATPPLVLQLADDITSFLTERWPVALALAVAMSALAGWVVRRPATLAYVDNALCRLPGIGALIQRTNVAVVSRTLGSLLRNGVPLIAGLTLTASVASNSGFKRALADATQRVKEGSKLTAALQKQSAFPDSALRFIAIGEEASRLDEMLIHLADVADADNERQIDNLLTMLTPAITLFVGLFIGGLILSVMQAVLSVNDIALQ